MSWEFATATRIRFGAGTAREAAGAARQMGARALLVTGSSPGRASTLLADLHKEGVGCTPFPVSGEPTVECVRAGVDTARREQCDLVIACGGGSAIDAGKAIAALFTNPGDPLDYLEVVGAGQTLRVAPAPFIALPTTAGTGSEVTRNAVLGSAEHGVKASLRSPLMLPRLAVIDPELTLELPPAVTASTGLDALTQLLEPFVSARANAMTDLYCREGMRLSARSLRRAFEHGDDLAARTDLAQASLFGGLALANAGLGAVHGFAAPIGGMFPAPHGAVCAALLAPVTRINIRALEARAMECPALPRYKEAARILTGNSAATLNDLAAWLEQLRISLGIPPLSVHGVRREDLITIAAKAAQASSMKANPIALQPEELLEALETALH
ncbi:MAG: iron-containing alcohol dehydrogenase [Acidobacteria bacterium]|nr:iron-containing alcohol dehydrogenase [Acidobacteriota bacterium]